MRVLYLPGPTPQIEDVRAALRESHPDSEVEVCAPESAPAWLAAHPECTAVVVDGEALPPEATWMASLRAQRADLPIAVLVAPGDAPGEARALLAGADASMAQTPGALARLGSLLMRIRRREADPERRDWRLWFAGRDTELRRAVVARLGRRVLLMSLSRDGKLVPLLEDPAQATALIVDARDAGEDMLAGLQRVRDLHPTLATVVVAEADFHAAFLRLGVEECVPPGTDVERLLLAVERLSSQRQLAAEVVALRARESRLRAVVEYLPEAVVLVAASRAVLAVNLAGLELLGAAEARQVIGRDLTPWLTTEGEGDLARFVDDVSTGMARELIAETRQTTPRRVVLRAVPFQREPGRPAAALISLRVLAAPAATDGTPPAPVPADVEETAELRARLAEAEAQLARGADAERRQQARVATLEHELAVVQQQAEGVAASASAALDEALLQQPSITALEAAVADERARAEALAARLSALEDAHAALRQEAEAREQARRADEAQFREVEARAQTLDGEASGLRETLQEVQASLEQARSALATAEADRARGDSELDSLRGQFLTGGDAHSAQVQALEHALARARSALEEERAALASRLLADQDSRSQVEEELRAQQTALAAQMSALEVALAEARAALDRERAEVVQRGQHVAALERALDEARQALDREREERAERAEQVSTLERVLAETRATFETEQHAAGARHAEERAVHAQALAAADARVAALETELTDLRGALDAARDEALAAQTAGAEARATWEARLSAAEAARDKFAEEAHLARRTADEGLAGLEAALAEARAAEQTAAQALLEAGEETIRERNAHEAAREALTQERVALEQARAEIVRLETALAAAHTQASSEESGMAADLADARGRLAEATAACAAAQASALDLEAELMAVREAMAADLAERQRHMAEAQQRLAEADAARAAAEARAADLQAEAEAARRAADAARDDAEAMTAQARAEADAAKTDAQHARAEADAADTRAEHARAEADAARAELEQARGEAEQVRAALAADRADAQQHLADAERRLTEALQRLAEAEAGRAAAQASAGAIEAELLAAHGALEAARADAAALEASIGRAQEDLDARAADVERARHRADELRDTLTRVEREGAARMRALEEERDALRRDQGQWQVERADLPALREAQRRVVALEGQLQESQRIRAQALALETEVTGLREAREQAQRLERELAEARAELEARPRPPARLEAAVDEETRWLLYDVASIGHLTTTPDARILGANDIAAQLLGHFSRDALQASGRLPEPLLVAAGAFAHRPTRFEVCLQHGEDGPLHWIVGLATPHAGVPATVTWMLIDVSEQRMHARRARFLRRMEAMTHVLSAATAESTTLVERATPLLDAAASTLGPREDLDIEGTRAALTRTQAVLTQLSSFARKRARRAGVRDVRTVLDAAGPVLVHVAGEDVACTIVPADEPLHASLEPAEFEQFLTALVMAGRDALPLGGRLTLATRAMTADTRDEGSFFTRPSVELTLRAEGYGAQLPENLALLQDTASRFGALLLTEFDGRSDLLIAVRMARVFVTT